MIVEHKKIELDQRVIFETIVSNSEETFNFHLNDEAYFVHVKLGNHIAITPSEIMEVPEGNLIFSVGQNLILKTYPNKEEDLYQAIIVHINRETILETLTRNFPEISSEEDREFSLDIITGKPCVVLQNYIAGILQYFHNQHIISKEIIEVKLKEILFLLLKSKKAEQVAGLLQDFSNKNTTSFKNTVENHIYSNISLVDLAQLCNMSLSTFKRHFKRIYNSSPTEYFFDQRLENSKKLLAASDQAIIDVAINSGFKTMSHYSRKFKEKYGISPSEYKMTLSDK